MQCPNDPVFNVMLYVQLQTVASSAKPLLDAIKRNGKHCDPMKSTAHLTSFIINTLFDALVNSMSTQDKSEKGKQEKLAIWFEAYRSVIMPPIYSTVIIIINF